MIKAMRDFSECNSLHIGEPQRGLELGFEDPIFGNKVLITPQESLVNCSSNTGQYVRPIHNILIKWTVISVNFKRRQNHF